MHQDRQLCQSLTNKTSNVNTFLHICHGSSSGSSIAPQEHILIQQRDASGHTNATAVTSQSSVVNEVAQRYVRQSPCGVVIG